MPRKKRRKSRKKRRRSRRGGILEIFKPQCWTNSPGVMAGKRPPRNDAEHKCCCGTNLGVTEWGGAPACKNKYEEECKKFSLTRPVNDMLETRKQKGQIIATEKEKEKGKKVRRYHMTRKLHKNPKIAALRTKNAHLYGQPCKSKFTGQLYEEVKPEYGKKISMGGPGGPCVERRGVDCSKPENNPSGVPIQHHTNWLASMEAFKQPPSEFQPGVVDKDGLACRPDWGGDLWGHPIYIQKKLAGKGEWCRLDPVESGWKSNKSKSNKQTCLGAANKNLFASALSAREKGRYYKDREGQNKVLEKLWKESERIRKEANRKFAAKYKKKLVEEKKQRTTAEVQKQAAAFAKKQSGNNAEFFNAEEGNVFFNTISNSNEIPMAEPVGGRRRSRRRKRRRKRRRTRRRRKKRRRKKRGGGWSPEYPRPAGGWTPAHFVPSKYAIKLTNNPNTFVVCEFLFIGDNNLLFFKKINNEEDFQVSENAILSIKTWVSDVAQQKVGKGERAGTPPSKKP